MYFLSLFFGSIGLVAALANDFEDDDDAIVGALMESSWGWSIKIHFFGVSSDHNSRRTEHSAVRCSTQSGPGTMVSLSPKTTMEPSTGLILDSAPFRLLPWGASIKLYTSAATQSTIDKD